MATPVHSIPKTLPIPFPAKKPPFRNDFTIENLTPELRQEFQNYDKKFSQLKNQAGKTMFFALLFFVPSVLVVFCGSLCLTLPGATVIRDVLFNALLPGTAGILMSIPLFYQTYLPSNEKRAVRAKWLKRTVQILNEKVVKPIDVALKDFMEVGGAFVENNFVPPGNQVYRLEFVRELKAMYKKDTTVKAEKDILKVISKTEENVIRARKPKVPPSVYVGNVTPNQNH